MMETNLRRFDTLLIVSHEAKGKELQDCTFQRLIT